MKYVFRTVLFHFICILFFGYIYMLSKSEFSEGTIDALDCFFLSTTIQSGVGYTLLTPTTYFIKWVIMIQQYFMISINVFLLYFLTNI